MHSHRLPTWRQPELPNWESWLLRHLWVMSMFLFTFNEKCHIIIMMPVTTVKPKVMVSRLLVLSDHSWELQATVWLLTSWTPLVHVRDLTTYNLRPPKKQKIQKQSIWQSGDIGWCLLTIWGTNSCCLTQQCSKTGEKFQLCYMQTRQALA